MTRGTAAARATEPAETRGNPGGRARLLMMALVLTAELAGLAWLLGRDPLIASRLRTMRPSGNQRELVEFRRRLTLGDPMPGTRLPLPKGRNLNPWSAQAASSTGGSVILFVGECTDCGARAVDGWQKEAARPGAPAVVVVSESAPSELREFLATRHYPSPFHADPKGTLSRRYNAVWTPRAYAVDSRGRLVWRQGPEGEEPSILLAEAARSLERTRP